MELDQKVEIATGIDSLAQVTVQVGINLKPGQQLIVLSPDGGVPIETLPLVRRVTEHAYRAGASLVTTPVISASCRAGSCEAASNAAAAGLRRVLIALVGIPKHTEICQHG